MYSIVLVLCLVASTNANISFKIFGGTNTTIGNHPYQVSIEDIASGHICGGALITPNTVLTAARCLRKTADNYRVRAGSTYKNKGGTLLNVDNYVLHNKYNNKSEAFDYDIAAVRVYNKFDLGPNIQVIPLTHRGMVYFTGDLASVTGWGSKFPREGKISSRENSKSSNESEALQEINVRFVGYDTCKRLYTQIEITNRMICFTEEGKGPCRGDEGGPLIYDNKLSGIISFSIGCARKEYPIVFVDIGHQPIWGWIQQFLIKSG